MKVTAETITDEQIRTEILHHGSIEERTAARLALGAMNETRRRDARARCAEILNARHGGPDAS